VTSIAAVTSGERTGAATNVAGAATGAAGVGVDASTGLISGCGGMLTKGAVLRDGSMFDVAIVVIGGNVILRLSRDGRLTPGGRFSGGRSKLVKSGRGAIPVTAGIKGGIFVDINGGMVMLTNEGLPNVVLADVRAAAVASVVRGKVVGRVGTGIPKFP